MLSVIIFGSTFENTHLLGSRSLVIFLYIARSNTCTCIFVCTWAYLLGRTLTPILVQQTKSIPELKCVRCVAENARELFGSKIDQSEASISRIDLGWTGILSPYHLDPKQICTSSSAFSATHPSHISRDPSNWRKRVAENARELMQICLGTRWIHLCDFFFLKV